MVKGTIFTNAEKLSHSEILSSASGLDFVTSKPNIIF